MTDTDPLRDLAQLGQEFDAGDDLVKRCPPCGAHTSPTNFGVRCVVCGWVQVAIPTPNPTSDPLRDLAQLGQEFDAGDALKSLPLLGYCIHERCVGLPCEECAALAAVATRDPARTPPPSLDEVVSVLREFIYETTHLSPCRDDGSHDCRISAETLAKGRALLTRIKERQ